MQNSRSNYSWNEQLFHTLVVHNLKLKWLWNKVENTLKKRKKYGYYWKYNKEELNIIRYFNSQDNNYPRE